MLGRTGPGGGLTPLKECPNIPGVQESSISSPDSEGSAALLSCPEGKHCRLILADENETLVYCDPLVPGLCPHAVLFEGTCFCWTLLGSNKRQPESAMPQASGHVLPAAVTLDVDPNKLTPEEQMARFAKDLKRNDWGHQPC